MPIRTEPEVAVRPGGHRNSVRSTSIEGCSQPTKRVEVAVAQAAKHVSKEFRKKSTTETGNLVIKSGAPENYSRKNGVQSVWQGPAGAFCEVFEERLGAPLFFECPPSMRRLHGQQCKDIGAGAYLYLGTDIAFRRIQAYSQLCSLTFLMYDHVLTLDEEVRYMWQRHKTFSTYCFLFNRYLALLVNISVSVLVFLSFNDQVRIVRRCVWGPFVNQPSMTIFTSTRSYRCAQYRFYHEMMLLVVQVTVCGLLVLRVYALYERSKTLLWLVLTIGGILLSVVIWLLASERANDGYIVDGCHIGLTGKTVIERAVTSTASVYHPLCPWLFVMALYISCKSLTVSATNNRLSTIYRIIGLCNLLNIFTFYLTGFPCQFANPFLRGVLASFSSCMSVTLISRLILRLHQFGLKGLMSTTRELSSYVFTSGCDYTGSVSFDHLTSAGSISTAPHPLWLRTPIPTLPRIPGSSSARAGRPPGIAEPHEEAGPPRLAPPSQSCPEGASICEA
ncbi:hypothetical protein FISHEDRAFT_56268 [Fistulina hepatica ATCC 64428]|uniref:DUF6533 domain-containing protein n=1 Tax=Fistulina hepatica ATCC 64428 TaxID=1128425 RepID=A0A0D7AL57_9AGAR|nr:hypothetical protein FISHEDRAFT_56268 [Fistulina hepatica ATCC 64428]